MNTLSLTTVMPRILLLISLSYLPFVANASLVNWTFQDFTFGDGGTLTGTFDYDADFNAYSNISITTFDGSGTPTIFGGTYSGAATSTATSGVLPIYNDGNGPPMDVVGELFLRVFFSTNLTNAGGTVGISSGDERICTSINPFSGTCDETFRYYFSGSVTGVPAIPIPPALWLFGSGLLGLVGVARRKKA